MPDHLDAFLALSLREPVERTRSAFDYYSRGPSEALRAAFATAMYAALHARGLD